MCFSNFLFRGFSTSIRNTGFLLLKSFCLHECNMKAIEKEKNKENSQKYRKQNKTKRLLILSNLFAMKKSKFSSRIVENCFFFVFIWQTSNALKPYYLVDKQFLVGCKVAYILSVHTSMSYYNCNSLLSFIQFYLNEEKQKKTKTQKRQRILLFVSR